MAKMDDRMELIGSAILSQAQREARDLIDKANGFRKQEISNCEEEIVDSMFSKVQAKSTHLRLESVKSIAREQLESHRVLLSYRAEKTQAVFANVRARLIEYAKAPEYRLEILECVKALKDSYDHSSSTIFIREEDMALGGEIKGILGDMARLQSDATIDIGGFKLRNAKARILVDETLDERLEEQKLWFLQSCGLEIM